MVRLCGYSDRREFYTMPLTGFFAQIVVLKVIYFIKINATNGFKCDFPKTLFYNAKLKSKLPLKTRDYFQSGKYLTPATSRSFTYDNLKLLNPRDHETSVFF